MGFLHMASWCAVAALCAAPVAAKPPVGPASGIVVRNGTLLRNGKPFRAIGINVTAIADDILANGTRAADSLEAIRYLGAKKVPFIRFWASYFSGHSRWLKDPATYWRNMDLLIGACEKAGLGIAPSLFWNDWQIPHEFGEFRYAWADEESKTRAYMKRYVREFVSRYGKRKCIWLFEFANETNLAWDLPNAMQFLPEGQKDARNIARSPVGILSIRSFARAIRANGARQPVTSGSSIPRKSQYHLASEDPVTGKPWTVDTPEQQYAAATWTAPDPVDLLCVHYYPQYGDYSPAAVRAEIAEYMRWSERMHKPLYIGEFAVYSEQGTLPEGFDENRYREDARDLLQAIYEAKTPLAAYWCYAGLPIHFGIGAVNPKYGRFDYMLDLIREYNDRIARDLAAGR